MDKKDVFRFKVTVDDFLCLQQRESMKDLPGKPTDQLDTESSEIMGLDEFVEVDPQQFSRYTQMTSEVKALGEINHTMAAMGIPFLELLKEVDFYQSLLVESFLVADDFDCNQDSMLVVDTSDNLAKAAFTQDVNNLIAVGHMITKNNVVVSTIVVIAKVRGRSAQIPNVLLCILGTAKIDVLKVDYLSTFKYVEMSHSYGLGRIDTIFGSSSVS